ncbi:MAG: hypothetical protein ACK2UK_13215, partial [Candidatus Promineifilaceae bacterium]
MEKSRTDGVTDGRAATAARLIPIVEQLRQDALDLERQHISDLEQIDLGHQASAQSLLHYVAVRRKDLRSVQQELAGLG